MLAIGAAILVLLLVGAILGFTFAGRSGGSSSKIPARGSLVNSLSRVAAIAAGRQDRMFNFAELLYVNQGVENSGWLSDRLVTSAAASIPGLDVPRLLAGRNTTATNNRAASFDRQASADGVNSTPTLLVGKSGGILRRVTLTSPGDAQSVAAALNKALR